MEIDAEVERAARIIKDAEALLICAGAGMGVDSGLPDFRGNEGFWNAYPPYRHLGASFVDMANPAWFTRDPSFAWGFYGHRRNLYRETIPHEGFSLLLRWGAAMKRDYFVYTSNVDNQFQKAGFDAGRIVECHGSIEWNQCVNDCGSPIFAADTEMISLVQETMHASPPLPSCPRCKALARPNILMFGDFEWDGRREMEQYGSLQLWLSENEGCPMAIIECGAGTAIPTVRCFSESATRATGSTLIRLNIRDPEVPDGHIGFAVGALEGLQAIAIAMKSQEEGNERDSSL
jgi:NAD-dependent SIR2 family protein deacetylase